jgi:hypothetical protein
VLRLPGEDVDEQLVELLPGPQARQELLRLAPVEVATVNEECEELDVVRHAGIGVAGRRGPTY